MHYGLLDRVLEQTPDRIVAVKLVSAAEEYLQDHFPTFPVLPGVMMLETMVQAGRRLGESAGDERLVLGQVRALKYGAFVTPGQALRVEVTTTGRADNGSWPMRGVGLVSQSDKDDIMAVSGRFTLRPIRTTVRVRQ